MIPSLFSKRGWAKGQEWMSGRDNNRLYGRGCQFTFQALAPLIAARPLTYDDVTAMNPLVPTDVGPSTLERPQSSQCWAAASSSSSVPAASNLEQPFSLPDSAGEDGHNWDPYAEGKEAEQWQMMGKALPICPSVFPYPSVCRGLTIQCNHPHLHPWREPLPG